MLIKEGLLAGLNELARRINKTGTIKIKLVHHDLPARFNEIGEISLYRIIQERVNNIVRHAMCARADIELKLEGPSLALVVADNGKGFDPNQVSDGNGLVSLQRRASALGGEIVVSSRRGEGTTVTIKIPYARHRRVGSGNRQRPHDATTMRNPGSPLE